MGSQSHARFSAPRCLAFAAVNYGFSVPCPLLCASVFSICCGEVTCACGSIGTGRHFVCGSAGTAFPTSAYQATCTVPTTTSCSVGSASGDVTIANFAPGGVTCAAGYTGTGSYTDCRSAGTAYSVSACQATCTVPTTTGYSVGSATGDVIIANFAPGGVTCTAGCSGTGVTLFADLLVLHFLPQRARQPARYL